MISNNMVKATHRKPTVIEELTVLRFSHLMRKKVIIKINIEPMRTPICLARKSPVTGARKMVRRIP